MTDFTEVHAGIGFDISQKVSHLKGKSVHNNYERADE